MNKEGIIVIVILIAFGITMLVVQNTVKSQLEYGCTKDAKDLNFPIGQRVYSPQFKLYGTVDDLRDDCSVLGINWDKSEISQQGVSDYIKVTNKTYLEIQDFPNYPSPVMKYYEIQWLGWYGNDEVNAHDSEDVKKYCEETYGNNSFKDKHACRVFRENNTEIIYTDYSVDARTMTLWRLQHALNNKSDNTSLKIIKESTQSFDIYTPINYTLLKGWLDYYNLTFNNQSLNINDFEEIKKKSIFMYEYCSVYGYTDYNGIACYRLNGSSDSGTLPQDPCANPKSEEVASACVKIMEARHNWK